MVNQFMIVGRIVEIKENGVIVNVPRAFKNEEGIYENDKLFIVCFDTAMEKIKEYCHINDTIGARGRIQSVNGNIELNCEKFTFLSSKKVSE